MRYFHLSQGFVEIIKYNLVCTIKGVKAKPVSEVNKICRKTCSECRNIEKYFPDFTPQAQVFFFFFNH